MTELNFIETYVPDYAELDQETLYATRERLVNFMRIKFADIDGDFWAYDAIQKAVYFDLISLISFV